jgi:uncharacterized protein YdaU (DUF1376 family)
VKHRQNDAKDSLAMLPWFPRDWRASASRAVLTPLQRGLYRELMDAAWLDGSCSLPDHDETLAALAGCPLKVWLKEREKVLACFERGEDGRLRQGRLIHVWDRSGELRLARRKAAEDTNARRWGVAQRPADRIAERVGERVATDSPASASPSASASASTNGENERSVVPDSGAPPNGNGHGVPEEQRQEYADAVWRAFLAKSGERVTRLMSPGEFNVLKAWMDTGVPLHLVERGIADTRGKGHSLGYYGPAVKQAIEQWRKAVA